MEGEERGYLYSTTSFTTHIGRSMEPPLWVLGKGVRLHLRSVSISHLLSMGLSGVALLSFQIAPC